MLHECQETGLGNPGNSGNWDIFRIPRIPQDRHHADTLSKLAPRLDWIELDWIGLDWIGLDGCELDWIGLDWSGVDWIGMDYMGFSGCWEFWEPCTLSMAKHCAQAPNRVSTNVEHCWVDTMPSYLHKNYDG